MSRFLNQLGWEFYKLCARPRTWFAFAAALLCELIMSVLLRVEGVRGLIARDLWRMRWHFNETFSGLTTAAHMLGEVSMVAGAFGIALVAGEIVAGESEDGTLRTMLCRPVSRTSVLAQKLIVCTVYTVVLTVFNGATALAAGLLFEGCGPLLMIAPYEEVIGLFDFSAGLARYGIAVGLLGFASFSGMAFAFALSCFKVRPATATALALALLLVDTTIRAQPALASARPWCLTTRLLSWRQAFNEEIPWTRVKVNYAQLAAWDAAWLGLGWLVFVRRDLTR